MSTAPPPSGMPAGAPGYRPVTDPEVPAVVDLMNRAYRGSGVPTAWSTEVAYIAGDRTTAALLRAEIARKPEASLLLWPDGATGRVVGCVWVEPLGAGTWSLGSLAVEPERQSAGLGRIMLAAAERRIADRGGRRVRITVVNLREPLIAWYGRRGYEATGATEPFPYETPVFGVPLRDDLCFVVLEKPLPGPV